MKKRHHPRRLWSRLSDRSTPRRSPAGALGKRYRRHVTRSAISENIGPVVAAFGKRYRRHVTRSAISENIGPVVAAFGKRYRRHVLVAAALLPLGWIAFFDSHSIARRIAWHHEYIELREENERLRADIAHLGEQIQRDLTDEIVEKIAREQYAMRRPGETVYRIQPSD